MDLKTLTAKGGVVADALVPKSITWTAPDGEALTFEVKVRRLSFGVVERLVAQASGHGQSTALISACIVLGENDEETLTPELVEALDPALAKAFAEAISEVNDPEKKPAT